MATTRIMPLHIGKGRTESRAISEIIDYVANLNIPPQTGQQNGGNRSRVTVEMSPGVRLQVQAVE